MPAGRLPRASGTCRAAPLDDGEDEGVGRVSLSTLAAAAALLGGVLLVLNLFVGAAAMPLVGGGLVLVGAAAGGAALVRTVWLASVCALGCAAAAWAAMDVVGAMAGEPRADAAVGGLATLAVAVAAMRGSTSENTSGNTVG